MDLNLKISDRQIWESREYRALCATEAEGIYRGGGGGRQIAATGGTRVRKPISQQ